MKTDYQPIFADAIFGTQYSELDMCKQQFVDFHSGEYMKYRREAARLFRQAIKKKLKHEYKDILLWYITRASIEDIKLGIRDGIKLANQLIRPITGVGWFNTHIDKWMKKRQNRITEYLQEIFGPCFFDPWFFVFYMQIQNGELQGYCFDPWWGLRETKKKKKKKTTLTPTQTWQKWSNRLKQHMDIHRRIEEYLKDQKYDPEVKKQLKSQLKNNIRYITRLQKQLKELEGQIKELEDG